MSDLKKQLIDIRNSLETQFNSLDSSNIDFFKQLIDISSKNPELTSIVQFVAEINDRLENKDRAMIMILEGVINDILEVNRSLVNEIDQLKSQKNSSSNSVGGPDDISGPVYPGPNMGPNPSSVYPPNMGPSTGPGGYPYDYDDPSPYPSKKGTIKSIFSGIVNTIKGIKITQTTLILVAILAILTGILLAPKETLEAIKTIKEIAK